MEIDYHAEMLELLASANSKSPLEGKRYSFTGDMRQMSIVLRVARQLGFTVSFEYATPFVTSEQDYHCVTQHLIDNQIEGWWHYVTNEQYREIKAKLSAEEMP